MDPAEKISPFLLPLKRAAPGEPQPPRPARAQKKKESDPRQTIDHFSDLIQENIGVRDFKLNFSIDQDTKTVGVKAIDAKTGKIIREISVFGIIGLGQIEERIGGLSSMKIFNLSLRH